MRLITNDDFDGVVCASMIADMEKIDEIHFAHPKDVEDGLVEVRDGDIVANLPFHPNASMWFDHHAKGDEVSVLPAGVKGRVGISPSAASLVYGYYNSEKLEHYNEVLKYVDKYDEANLTYEEVLKPESWVLLGITLDSRTALGDTSEYALEIIAALRKGLPINEILELPVAKGRVRNYLRDEIKFKKEIMRCTDMEGPVSITDFRGLDEIPVGNRFQVFALFSRCNVNVRVYDHRDVTKVMVAVGKSIFDRSNTHHIGDLMAKYGGGGLEGAGSCPLPVNGADGIINDIVKRLKLQK